MSLVNTPANVPWKALRSLALGFVCTSTSLGLLQGCRRDVKGSASSAEGGGFDQPPGGKAGSVNEAKLASLRRRTTDKPPAAIRPDPDLYVRRLLRQYRAEGPLIARQIGKVEEFRLLLGGASEDFRTAPQETYDATSLLAMQKVAEDICKALVAPSDWEHPGWSTILPYPASSEAANLKFLAQRLLGVPSARVPAEALADLAKLTADAPDDDGEYGRYIPACIALSTDAEALLL